MAAVPNTQGAILTVGFVTDVHRFQCVIPFVSDTPLTNANEVAIDFLDYVSAQLLPLWLQCLAKDCYAAGMTLEGMAGDIVLPTREVFAPDDFVGTNDADSTPPQSSMLIAFYSADQIAGAGRTICAKSFIGPAPETLLNSGIIDDSDLKDALVVLGGKLLLWDGSETGLTWHRAMEINTEPGGELWKASVSVPRETLFTQRRRASPIF